MSAIQQAPPALVRELEEFERRLASTYQAKDCDGWAAMLGDEWTVTHVTGQVMSKTDALAICRGIPEVTSRYEDLKVRSYGTMAIVTGINHASAATTPPTNVRLRFTDVLVRRNNTWVVVASHATTLQAK